MNKEAFLEYLRNSKYKFHAHGDIIEVRIGFSQRVIVDFTHDGRPEITDRMIPWNFLTGLIPMKFKSAFVYNVMMCLFFNRGVCVFVAYSGKCTIYSYVRFGDFFNFSGDLHPL